MKVREILEQLDDLKDQERANILGPLTKLLCPASWGKLRDIELRIGPLGDFGPNDFEAFKKVQNKLIRELVATEMKPIGTIVRKACKLEPLTLETGVNV